MANEDQEHTDVPFYTHLRDKKSDNTRHLRGCGSTGSLKYCQWWCKLVQSFLKNSVTLSWEVEHSYAF